MDVAMTTMTMATGRYPLSLQQLSRILLLFLPIYLEPPDCDGGGVANGVHGRHRPTTSNNYT